jgi:two-component system CheB/CheR fusion protein
MSEETPTSPEQDSHTPIDGSPPIDALPPASGDTAVPASIEPDEDEQAEDLLPYPVVAIGASAGGLEAYIELFKNLASDTGMAYVLVPHLSPEHRSHLPSILSHHASIPVSEIEHGAHAEANHVYVLPPNMQLSMQQGAFQLEPRHPGERMVMPIDRFFRSVASDQKNRVIGILLSGADSDGALGLKAIKGEGGIAIVQDPDSARFGDMPRSGMLADHVDLVLPPAQIGSELSRLARQFFQPSLRPLEQGRISPSDEPQFNKILALLRTIAGIDFRNYKPGTVRRRIARRMVLRRMENLAEYSRFLQESRDELGNLHEDVLINVSRFFRDLSVFETLNSEILPGIFQDRSPDQQVRFWVAGCSTGEEAYSIAICILEYLTGRPAESPIQIFGTDASDDSISKARAGWYPETIAGDVSPDRLRRFFVKNDKGYQVSKRVRDLCIFARQNLTNDPPFSRLDLISCRNVLIYLQPEIQRYILSTFHYALRSNGVLLLGRSESVPHAIKLFAPLDRKERFYAKLGDSIPQPPISGGRIGEVHVAPAAPVPPRPLLVEDVQRAADRVLLARYGPPGVLVNDRLEIVEVRGRPSPFLSIGPGPASLSLLRMTHADIVAIMRDALHQAADSGAPVSQHVSVEDAGGSHHATLEILPVHPTSRAGAQYLVLFVPPARYIDSLNGPARSEGIENSVASEQKDDTDRLRRELTSNRVYLQSLIEDRDARNQELMAAYEEIQSSNEELQSTNEELETAKEELQSGNEELHTVNDELRNRNAALLQSSNDFINLLNSVNIPVIMLGSDLTIRQYTPPAERLMRLRQADIGRPIGEIRLNLMVDDVEPLIQEVADTLATKEMEVQDRSGRWHLLRLRPYRTSENKIEGVVLVLLDIDQMKRTQEALQRSRDFAQTVVEAVPVPVIVLDGELRIRTANAAFRSLSALSFTDLEHRSCTELLTLLWDWPNPRERLQPLLEKGAPVLELEHETNRPSVLCFRLVARAVHADLEAAILVILEDITTQKMAERLLEAERERLAGQVQSTTEVLGRTREELHALAGRLFISEEEERRRVARELHDDISQRLAVLEMDIETLRKGLPADPSAIRTELERIRERSRALSEEVRGISHQLHPSALDHLGIAVALKSLVEEFGAREAMVATFHSRNVPENPRPEVAVALYRITQEALRNVAKHAGRTHVKVVLEGIDQRLRLEVRDFGEGFDMEGMKGGGLGLISMAERARLIGGTLALQSALGEGAAVSVTVPLSEGSTP